MIKVEGWLTRDERYFNSEEKAKEHEEYLDLKNAYLDQSLWVGMNNLDFNGFYILVTARRDLIKAIFEYEDKYVR